MSSKELEGMLAASEKMVEPDWKKIAEQFKTAFEKIQNGEKEARMTPEQFAYWLQGFVELQQTVPTPEQWDSIKEHLACVFHKVTPPVQPTRVVDRFEYPDFNQRIC